MTIINNHHPVYTVGTTEPLSKDLKTHAINNTELSTREFVQPQDTAQPSDAVDLKEKLAAARQQFEDIMKELQFFLRLLQQYEDRFKEAMDDPEEETAAPAQVTENGVPLVGGACGSVTSAATAGA
jgi:hypothetical protein